MSAERKAIEKLHVDWLDCFHRGDVKGILELYSDDMKSLTPGKKAVTSKAELMEVFDVMFKAAGGKGLGTDYTIDSFKHLGDYIYITGEFKIFTKETDTLLQYCKHVVIFKKVKGEWRYHLDLWCDNGPVAFEEASKQHELSKKK